MEFLHTALHVGNLDRSVAFYTGELGFTETWGFEAAEGEVEHRYVEAENGIELQLTHVEGEEVRDGTGFDHIALAVDDLDATLDDVDHYGLERGPLYVEAADARVAFVEDPDGHLIEFVEPQ